MDCKKVPKKISIDIGKLMKMATDIIGKPENKFVEVEYDEETKPEESAKPEKSA